MKKSLFIFIVLLIMPFFNNVKTVKAETINENIEQQLQNIDFSELNIFLSQNHTGADLLKKILKIFIKKCLKIVTNLSICAII